MVPENMDMVKQESQRMIHPLLLLPYLQATDGAGLSTLISRAADAGDTTFFFFFFLLANKADPSS